MRTFMLEIVSFFEYCKSIAGLCERNITNSKEFFTTLDTDQFLWCYDYRETMFPIEQSGSTRMYEDMRKYVTVTLISG